MSKTPSITGLLRASPKGDSHATEHLHPTQKGATPKPSLRSDGRTTFYLGGDSPGDGTGWLQRVLPSYESSRHDGDGCCYAPGHDFPVRFDGPGLPTVLLGPALHELSTVSVSKMARWANVLRSRVLTGGCFSPMIYRHLMSLGLALSGSHFANYRQGWFDADHPLLTVRGPEVSGFLFPPWCSTRGQGTRQRKRRRDYKRRGG